MIGVQKRKITERNTEDKREREKKVVELMIRLYCKKKHRKEKIDGLCEDCRILNEYAKKRTDFCPFMETKTFCSNCRVHCYKREMREKIREVMKFSGPRMVLYYPLTAFRHMITSVQEKKRIEREEKND